MAKVDETEMQKPDDVILAEWLDASGDPGGAPPETIEAIEDVLIERRRQIVAEGFSPDHDSAHNPGKLACAAAAYAWSSGYSLHAETDGYTMWPFTEREFKPRMPRENLVRAGALILAAIEHLDRAEAARAGAN